MLHFSRVSKSGSQDMSATFILFNLPACDSRSSKRRVRSRPMATMGLSGAHFTRFSTVAALDAITARVSFSSDSGARVESSAVCIVLSTSWRRFSTRFWRSSNVSLACFRMALNLSLTSLIWQKEKVHVKKQISVSVFSGECVVCTREDWNKKLEACGTGTQW